MILSRRSSASANSLESCSIRPGSFSWAASSAISCHERVSLSGDMALLLWRGGMYYVRYTQHGYRKTCREASTCAGEQSGMPTELERLFLGVLSYSRWHLF